MISLLPLPAPELSPGAGGWVGSSSGCARPLAPASLQSLPDLGILFLARVICPYLKQGKVQFVDSDQLLFYGDALGPTKGSLGRPWVKLERLHGQAPLFLSFHFHLAVRLWS
jgi:hypothetical protein